MAFESLFDGLKNLEEGVKAYKTSKIVGEATLQVDDLKKQFEEKVINEQQFRKSSFDMAKKVQAKLLGIGADVSDIDRAFQTFAPKQYGSIEQAELDKLGIQGASEQDRLREKLRQKQQIEEYKQKVNIETEAKKSLLESKQISPISKPSPIPNIPGYEHDNSEVSKSDVSKIRDAQAAYLSVKHVADRLEALAIKVGSEGLSNKDKAELNQLQGFLKANQKNAIGLGILSESDFKLLDEVGVDLTSIGSNIRGILSVLPGIDSPTEIAKQKLLNIRNIAENNFENRLIASGYNKVQSQNKNQNSEIINNNSIKLNSLKLK